MCTRVPTHVVFAALAASTVASAALSPHASRVAGYDPGSGAGGFTDSAAALGPPTRTTDPGTAFGGATTPFQAAFGANEVVSIGRGGSLTVEFDHPVVDDPFNPFGIDLIIFGNAFHQDIAFPDGVAGPLFAEGGTVSVSVDGVHFVTVPDAVADGLYPTLGFLNPTAAATVPGQPPVTGTQPTDFTRPVDPAFDPSGRTLAEIIAGYAGSGGGNGIDIGALGLRSVRAIRIETPVGAAAVPEVDAFSDVRPIEPRLSAEHPTLGGTNTRISASTAASSGPDMLDEPAWVFPGSDPDVTGQVRFVLDSSPVVAGRLVIVAGKPTSPLGGGSLIAVDRATGRQVWRADVPAPVFDSWGSPAVDRLNGAVLHAAGTFGAAGGVVQARRLIDGSLLWQTPLARDVVNASPLVTADRGPRDRAFVTDFEGFYAGGEGGALYCINVDPFDADRNPYEPGEIVWRAPLMTGLSGATPAYDGQRVYIATAGTGGVAGAGEVIAFDAGATDADAAPLWRTSAGGDDAFFGGVAVAGGAIFAATYDFFGGRDSARLAKLDAGTGDLLWTAPANRTASIPVPLPGRRLLLSTGIAEFGTTPALQIYEDFGTAAVRTHDTTDATLADDGDGVIEAGEFEIFGGWTHQPLVALQHPRTGGPVAFVGSISTDTTQGSFFAGYTRLSMIDLSVPFGSPGWVLADYEGAGGSPAVAGRTLYTLGGSGLVAFGVYCPADQDADGVTSFFDLLRHLAGVDARSPLADITLDGEISAADTAALLGLISEGCP